RMTRLLTLLLLAPLATHAAIQCYVGQKLFSLESNMAVCAPFIPYHCAAACEWRPNCTSHVSYDAFDGRRTFVSGVLVNSKSLMLLCCASLSTQVQADRHGERCAWRGPDSIPVLGPSIRADPVLGINHYIREIKMERDGDARVDVQLEVCQYEKELDQCKEEKMTDTEIARFNELKDQLEVAKVAQQEREERRFTATPPAAAITTTLAPTTVTTTTAASEPSTTAASFKSPKIVDGDKEGQKKVDKEDKADACQSVITSECGRNIHSRIMACCKDLAACDRVCLKGVEKSLLEELIRNERKCTTREVRQTLDCLARKVTNHALAI
ncbi:hypothetical protein PENTCL1PPCAC_25032, partial [Pristionchus entomophagus]